MGRSLPEKHASFGETLITTAFTLPGYKITQNLGIVRGITVRSRDLVTLLGALIRSLFGGNIGLFVEMCEKARHEAYSIMIDHASQIGANAIIGVNYDATELASGITEVLCYGTAVVVEKE